MALPVVKSAIECSDFSSTVLPYVHQLKSLPQIIFESISNPAALKQIYLDTNPLISAFAFSLSLIPIFLVLSEVNKNYSQVDRCWSILPTIYNAHYVIYAHMLGLETKRLDTLLAASAIWSIRLTSNYWRKGGYSIGSEDYRWEVLRTKISLPLFFIFNIIFISFAQSVLLFSISTPTYILLLGARLAGTSASEVPNWEICDLIISRIMVGCLLLSFFADQQQWKFQQAKQQYQKTAKVPFGFNQADLDRGFVVTGLWSWSRHPNFAAEQTFWVTLYQWGCYTSGSLFNWTGIGAVAYLILFQASTWFTELISAKKYPEYKEYQARVGKFIPKRLSGGPVDTSKSPLKKADDDKTTDKETVPARETYDLR